MNLFSRIFTVAVFSIACAFTVVACDDSTSASDDHPSAVSSSDEVKHKSSSSRDSDEYSSSEEEESASSSSVSAASSSSDGLVKKFTAYADEVGFYNTLVILNPELAASKGKVEIFWFSHNDVSNTEEQVLEYVADYETNSDGTFKIYCTLNGLIDKNMNANTELKIAATVGATIRGERLEIYYTPDGGKRELVKTAEGKDHCVATSCVASK